MKPRVLMAGPAEHLPGGMSAVVLSYRRAGLFEALPLRYLSRYEGAAALMQLRVFGAALWRLLLELLAGRVDLLHVHSASRGSFWRKSLLCGLCRAFGKPYLFHIHSGEFGHFYREECGPLARWWLGPAAGRAAGPVQSARCAQSGGASAGAGSAARACAAHPLPGPAAAEEGR